MRGVVDDAGRRSIFARGLAGASGEWAVRHLKLQGLVGTISKIEVPRLGTSGASFATASPCTNICLTGRNSRARFSMRKPLWIGLSMRPR
jgi:hypothetical protein